MVTDLIAATPEDDVLRRDIFDRPPMFKWTAGRVALLGDSAHAMQPNLGQGGCMAIEDAYELAKLLNDAMDKAPKGASAPPCSVLPYEGILSRYQRERVLRASAIHGMARMAAVAASTYKAHLFEQFGLDKHIKIPHPGRVVGRLVLALSMPSVLGWVLGGNTGKIEVKDRAQYCNISDQPHGFAEKDWKRLMSNDEELLAASQADWLLVPVKSCGAEVRHLACPLQCLAPAPCPGAGARSRGSDFAPVAQVQNQGSSHARWGGGGGRP
jgi:zeaxanthin epoxidase